MFLPTDLLYSSMLFKKRGASPPSLKTKNPLKNGTVVVESRRVDNLLFRQTVAASDKCLTLLKDEKEEKNSTEAYNNHYGILSLLSLSL